MNRDRVFHLLLVDDDPLIHQSMKLLLPPQWRLLSATQMSEVPFDRFFHAAFVDMHLNPNSKQPIGLMVIERLNSKNPLLEIIAISGDLNRELMENCLKVGAQKFLAKPLFKDELLLLLGKIEALWDLRSLESQSKNSMVPWIGESESAIAIRKNISTLRGESRPVLIEGETGTGKEVVAKLLNYQDGDRPFISVNMASLPENLFESEMFGFVKGAFTGADYNKIGLCEAAHGGDLFLDEIEALAPAGQAKLLRFLESGEIRKIGAKETQIVRCRIIAASNQNLKHMVEQKQFREDLYFRICTHRIEISPLRERKGDIGLLAEFILKQERPFKNKRMTPEAINCLQSYSWPGNVRELKRICEQLSLTSPLPIIREEDVKSLLFQQKMGVGMDRALDYSEGLIKTLEKLEKKIIQHCLEKEKDVEKSAEVLGISRSNLYKKIKDYGLSGY